MPDVLPVTQGETRPWTSTLTSDGDDDLTDISSVVAYMREKGSAVNKIDGGSVTITSATAAQVAVKFEPAGTDVDEPGEYEFYWKATFADGKVGYWPTDRDAEVLIRANFE